MPVAFDVIVAIMQRSDEMHIQTHGKTQGARASQRGLFGWLGRLLRNQAGMSAIEFALASPVLLAIVAPTADLGVAFSEQIQVQQAAQAGAQYALLHGFSSTSISNAVTSATVLNVTATPAPSQSCGCPNGTGITAATCGTTCSNGENAGEYVYVNAQTTYTPVVPYSLFGSSVTLTAQATVRVQ
jgi:Flp pilus assembly protein TadG